MLGHKHGSGAGAWVEPGGHPLGRQQWEGAHTRSLGSAAQARVEQGSCLLASGHFLASGVGRALRGAGVDQGPEPGWSAAVVLWASVGRALRHTGLAQQPELGNSFQF